MLKSLAKAIAYFKAPKKTFLLLHPRKAIKWGGVFVLAKFLFDRVKGRRPSRSRA
jgi:hypothetical protein